MSESKEETAKEDTKPLTLEQQAKRDIERVADEDFLRLCDEAIAKQANEFALAEACIAADTRCKTCDRPLATKEQVAHRAAYNRSTWDDDFPGGPSQCECASCVLVCFGANHCEGCCTGEPVNWRERARRAEAAIRKALAMEDSTAADDLLRSVLPESERGDLK
jgi:hypothetical protein